MTESTRPPIGTDEVVEPQSLGAIPGSHPADQAPSGLGASRFDPERWQPIETPPKDGTVVAVFRANMTWDRSFGAIRDYVERCELGWFEDGRWWEAGTAHDMFEPWREDTESLPTHWLRLPAPPASVDTLPKGQDAKQGLAGTEGSAVAATGGETPTPGPAIDQDGGEGGLANIEGDQIVIRVPISTMQYAACGAMEECNVEVTNDLQAAKGVVRYLNDEDEEGSTLVHFALDKALKLAVENGEEGFSEPPAQPENDQCQD